MTAPALPRLSELNVPAGSSARDMLVQVAYEAHFALCQHYSSLVFKGRLAILTLTVGAVSVALGLTPENISLPAESASAFLSPLG